MPGSNSRFGRFQHTAARRRLARPSVRVRQKVCFNTQPPEGGWSTKPRIKSKSRRFNTQPPEGGWSASAAERYGTTRFNTQPPEGGWNIWQTL